MLTTIAAGRPLQLPPATFPTHVRYQALVWLLRAVAVMEPVSPVGFGRLPLCLWALVDGPFGGRTGSTIHAVTIR